jgi:acyl transferase domain-containing protein/aryl carrier-like protein
MTGKNGSSNSPPHPDEAVAEAPATGLEIAVIGMAGRFPGARGIHEFWDNLKHGVESVSYFTDFELEAAGAGPETIKDPAYVKSRGALLERKEYFDAFFFDYLPGEARVMDPQMRIFHEIAWEALEDAGYVPGDSRLSIGVYAGASPNTGWEMLTLLSGHRAAVGDFAAQHLIFNEYLSTRVSYKLGLKGPSFSVQTACSTSLVAVHLACQGILSGECDIALAGGVSINVTNPPGYLHREGMINSGDGHCRAFDARAGGAADGQGAGIVVLKALEDALDDRDFIYAVIKGTAINNDGADKVGFSAPGVRGQIHAIRSAITAAGVAPETIGYVETHGTGTALGDPVEIDALKQVFDTPKKTFCAIGSVKTNIGHLTHAAGVTGLIKTVLALFHKQLPPSLHFETPNPRIDIENSPFYVNTRLKEWHNNTYPLRAGVSSFGIGGTNAHAVLEEAPVIEPGPPGPALNLFILSAKTPTALETASQNLCRFMLEHPNIDFADAAYTLQVGRKSFPYRKMVIAPDAGQLIEALSDPYSPEVKTMQAREDSQAIVFLFSGQGHQYVNMGLDLYRTQPYFKQIMDNCADILRPILGLDIRDLLYPAHSHKETTDTLNRTHILQPVTFSFQYALSSLLIGKGIVPRAVMGHSLGEYAAACVAGIFPLEDALKLVALRGELMQTTPPGSILSVPLSEEQLKPYIRDPLELAAVNSSEQCLVSGPPEAVDALARQLEQDRVDCRKLHVPLAGHTRLMEPIMEPLTEGARQARLKQPRIPHVSGPTGRFITAAEATDAGYWARQLRQTVRFNDGISYLMERRYNIFIEIGPGNALSSTLQQNPGFQSSGLALNVSRHPREDIPDDYYLLDKIGYLWLWGGRPYWQALHDAGHRRRVPLPSYPFESERYWIEQEHWDRLHALERSLIHGLPGQAAAPSPGIPRPTPPTPQTAPRRLRPQLATPYKEPGNHTQQALVDIWQDFFGIGEIGILDNFFHLGGDSLKMMSLSTRIHGQFNIKLPLAQFFKVPTIRELAEVIDETMAGSSNSLTAPIPPVPEREYYELSYAQAYLWRISQNPAAGISYTMLYPMDLEGELNIDALSRAFRALIRRHESLRTSFEIIGGTPVQGIHPDIQFQIDIHTAGPKWPSLPGIDYPFDLAGPPLFHVTLLKQAADKHTLLFGIHHIISDGWTMDIFSRELSTLYNAYNVYDKDGSQDGEPDEDPLAPLTLRYRDYAAWQRHILEHPSIEPVKQYWHRKLAGDIPPLDFPADFPRPAEKTWQGNAFIHTLDQEVVSNLYRLGKEQDATLFMTLLAVVKVLIMHYTGQEDITTGTQAAGRIHPALEDQAGYFVNLLPLRDTLNPAESFETFLARVKQTASEAFDNQIYPFEKLGVELNVPIVSNRHPLFDIMVDLQNYEKTPLNFDDLKITPVERSFHTSWFDLSFVFVEKDPDPENTGNPGEILLGIEYDTGLFKEARIRGLCKDFEQLVQRIAIDSKQPLNKLLIPPS